MALRGNPRSPPKSAFREGEHRLPDPVCPLKSHALSHQHQDLSNHGRILLANRIQPLREITQTLLTSDRREREDVVASVERG